MKGMSSLHQFFSEIDCHFQCYNMGRRIGSVNKQTFIDFENTESAWKMPFLQHAWFALVFWTNETGKNKEDKIHESSETLEQHVWFLKLPLDEQAKLNLAARDDFLRRLFEALGDYISHTKESDAKQISEKLHSLESAMKDNPYGFQPKQEQLANFHAIVHKQLSLPVSSFYHSTQSYFVGNQDFNKWNEWEELGFQGFADIAARLDEAARLDKTGVHDKNVTNEQLIIKAIPHLPIEPFQVLSACLENQVISPKMTQAIYERLETALESKDAITHLTQLCIASIRASSQSIDQSLHIQLLSKILQSEQKADIEILATLSARSWTLISTPEILPLFLEALATADIQDRGAFKAILSDLMFIPGMRSTILQAFRSPERSQVLAQAIGTFFNSL